MVFKYIYIFLLEVKSGNGLTKGIDPPLVMMQHSSPSMTLKFPYLLMVWSWEGVLREDCSLLVIFLVLFLQYLQLAMLKTFK